MSTRPDLTDAEIDEICAGLTQNAAIARTASDGQPVYTVGDVVEYQPS